MGYRSEVAYRIVFKDKQVLNEFIALVMMKGGLEAQALRECEVETLDNGRDECFVNFYAQDVKWYPSFPDVQAHTWLYEYAVDGIAVMDYAAELKGFVEKLWPVFVAELRKEVGA